MRPWLLRPARRCSDSVSDFSGFDRVTSSNVCPVIPRRPGDVGLYDLTAIRFPQLIQCSGYWLDAEEINALARCHRHVSLLPFLLADVGLTHALAQFGRHHGGVDLQDAHVEDGLDRLGDLPLVRPDVNL